jgi:hypothetical protein
VLTYGTQDPADGRPVDLLLGRVQATGGTWRVPLTSRLPELPDLDLHLAVPGDHNAANAAAALLAGWAVGADPEAVARGLAEFRGTGRRFEDRGTADGVRVVDDYAHHPTEVAALLRTARTLVGDGRVLVLFQPHLFSRTRTFATEFGQALDLADQVVVTDVYAAREDPDPSITGGTIVAEVPTPGRAEHVGDRHEAALAIARAARPGDLLLTVGAGDVTALAPVVLAALAERAAAAGETAPDEAGESGEDGAGVPSTDEAGEPSTDEAGEPSADGAEVPAADEAAEEPPAADAAAGDGPDEQGAGGDAAPAAPAPDAEAIPGDEPDTAEPGAARPQDEPGPDAADPEPAQPQDEPEDGTPTGAV